MSIHTAKHSSLLERYVVYCDRVADSSEEPTASISKAVLRFSRRSLQKKAASSSDKPATYQPMRRHVPLDFILNSTAARAINSCEHIVELPVFVH